MSKVLAVRLTTLVSEKSKRNAQAWFHRNFWGVVAFAMVLAMFATALWIISMYPAPLYR